MTMREKMARALHAAIRNDLFVDMKPFDEMDDPWKQIMREEVVDAALDALMEPTKAMMESALPYMDSFSSNGAWWEAMVTAAKDGK